MPFELLKKNFHFLSLASHIHDTELTPGCEHIFLLILISREVLNADTGERFDMKQRARLGACSKA